MDVWPKDHRASELASQRETYRNHEISINHKNYQNARNKLYKVIKETKENFLRKALCDNQPTKVWKTVDRILNKQHHCIKLHPSDLNTDFPSLASRLTHKDNLLPDFTDFLIPSQRKLNSKLLKWNTPTTMKLEKSYLEYKTTVQRVMTAWYHLTNG